MKKYLLRILTVLLIVCFGACLFAACGGEPGENPDDEPATYTLTYQANGGTGADITEKHKEGEKVTLKGADTFTYDGHTFTGWNDGTTTYEAGNEFTMPASNVTMKAQWQENGSDVPAYTVKVTDPSGKAHVEFDKQGPYHKGDVVKFTVDFAPGENLRVTSVKADGAELQKGEDGMYTVTFAEKDIEIVIASESTEAHEFTVSLSVTGDGNGNSAELDKKGTVGKDEKVTLTVVTADGYSVEVKLNGNHVDLNAEGKYELTVTADAAFTVTFMKNGENPPAKTYTVTCTSQHVTVKFDQNGPYNTGTVVTFTVTAEAGYEIVSVKNGSDTLQEQNGKYSVTVGEADIVITVETREVTTPQPQGKEFKEFLIADIQRLDAVKFQISIQAKAEGYTSPDEMKADVKLLIGTQEFSANLATLAESGIYNLFFPVEIAQLTIEKDASAPVKLKSTAAGKTYDCPATSVNETLNSVQFEHDIYTLQYASNALTLKHTQVEVVEKKITFAGTSFGLDGEGKLYITLNLQTQGYEEAAVLAAKLKIGTLEFSVRADASNKNALRFDLTGGTPTVENLTAEKHAVVLVVGEESYECPTVMTGEIGKETKDNRTYTLKEEGGKLYLTVESSSVTPPPSTGYTVTYTGEHVTVTFEKNGPYEANTVVYFTVTVDSGYKLVSVKKGDTVLNEEGGKYSVTVTDANIVLTIETASDGTTPQPSDKALKEFADSNVLGLNDTTFQLILRAKADGYANEEELKADVKLLIGIVEFEANQVTKAESGIYNLFFHIEVSKLANMGDSAEVKLKLISANKTYDCPATAVNDKEFQVQFEHDIYTLKLEGNKLVLAHTRVEVVEKKITFADTTFDKHGTGEIYLMLNITTQGYEAAEIEAAKLKVGELTFAAITDPANKSVLRFDLTGGDPTIASLSAEKYAVVLVVGSEEYPCPSLPNAGVKTQEKDGKTFKLQPEEGKLYLTVEGGTPAPQLDPIEGVWTGAEYTADDKTASFTAYVKKGENYIDFLLEMRQVGGDMMAIQVSRFPKVAENDYKITTSDGDVEVLLSEGKLVAHMGSMHLTFTTRSTDMGSVTLPASGTYSGTAGSVNVSVTFGAQPKMSYDGREVSDPEFSVIGKYIVCLEKSNGSVTMALVVLSAGADENTLTANYNDLTITLTKEGATPTEKEIKEFGSTNLITSGDGFAIFIRVKPSGYQGDDEIKNDIKFSIGSLQLSPDEIIPDNDFRILKFSITKAQALSIAAGDNAAVITAGGKTYEKPCSIVSEAENTKLLENKTFLLNVKDEKLYLTVTETTGPVDKQVTSFADINIVSEEDSFAIYVRVQTNGYADDEAIKADIKLKIGDLEVSVESISGNDFKVLRFFVAKAQAQSLKAGDFAIVLTAGTHSYEKPYTVISAGQPSATVAGLGTFTLTEKESKLYLNVVAEQSAPQPAVQTTVTFDVDGDTTKVSPQTYDEGNTFQAPAAPTKENYTFLYWYYLNDGQETKVEDGFVPSDHDDENHKLTLYAKWGFDVKIGTPDNQKVYPAETPDYTETLRKGEIVTFSGTMTSQGSNNWNGPLFYIFSTPTAWGNMRADNWINSESGDGDHVTISGENFTINKDVPPPHWEQWTDMLKAASLTITFNWEFDNVIYISVLIRGDNGVTNGMVYSVTPTEGNTLKDSYTIGISCEESYLVLNERKVNLATAHTTHTYADGICSECGAVQPAAQVSDGTALDTSWTAGTFDTHKWENNTFAKGSKVAIYGTQTKASVTEAWLSLIAEVDFTDNSKSVTLRTDNYGWYFDNSADVPHLVEGARKVSYLRSTKNLGEMFTEWEIVKNILAACDYCVEFDWTGNDIVVTMTFTATSGKAVGYTYVQQYTVAAGEAQTVGVRFGAEQAAGTASKVVTVAAPSSSTKQSAVISSGETLVYEATVGEIGSAEADGIVAQLNIGENGKYVRFCPNGLYINSDDGEEEISLYGYSERKMFNGAELAVEASIDLPQLLNAKKKA